MSCKSNHLTILLKHHFIAHRHTSHTRICPRDLDIHNITTTDQVSSCSLEFLSVSAISSLPPSLPPSPALGRAHRPRTTRTPMPGYMRFDCIGAQCRPWCSYSRTTPPPLPSSLAPFPPLRTNKNGRHGHHQRHLSSCSVPCILPLNPFLSSLFIFPFCLDTKQYRT